MIKNTVIRTRQKLTKIIWYKYFGAKFTKPAPVHSCIDSLLHRLISYQWWQVHPQSLCQQQACLPWFLPCCVLTWPQCMQRTWHFLHKPCATLPRCSAVGGINGYPHDGAAARRRSINRVADKQRS